MPPSRPLGVGMAAVEKPDRDREEPLLRPGLRVLDAGCGTGALTRARYNTSLLRGAPLASLNAFDPTPAMLSQLRTALQRRRTRRQGWRAICPLHNMPEPVDTRYDWPSVGGKHLNGAGTGRRVPAGRRRTVGIPRVPTLRVLSPGVGSCVSVGNIPARTDRPCSCSAAHRSR